MTAPQAPRTFVLGASGGIGAALARALHARGHILTLAARPSPRLSALAEELGARREELDATDFDAVEAAVACSTDAMGGLSGAVNAVGSILLKPAQLTSAAEFEETWRQNVGSAFALLRAAAPKMRSGGALVFVSSCAASAGLPQHEAISAAKAGIEGLIRSAAASLARKGVRVNGVAPGLVRTPMTQRLTANPKVLKASEAKHPLGRIGEPADVAAAIAWLLGDEASWVTGQVLGVDGGLAALRP